MTRTFICALALFAASCSRPEFRLGDGCSLNSDCEEPWVCGLERCRRQCDESRDCAAGLMCLRVTDQGVCQLPEEAMCALASDCNSPLVCRFGTCTTECMYDRDCSAGATCEPDPDADCGTECPVCIETNTEPCIYNSDCIDEANPYLICSPERRCQFECHEDVDCLDFPATCNMVDHRCYPMDSGT